MKKWISREEEASFPEFDSFSEAWKFFVSKYDRDIVLETVEVVDDKKCYFCALVVDWPAYNEMCELLETGLPAQGLKYINCKQPVQIFEDGRIHIVH